MATVLSQNDPNNPQQSPSGPLSTGGSGGAASATAGVGGSSATSPVQQNQAPQQTSNFNDVSAYLNANQSGGQQLGQNVAQNLTNQYNTTKSGIDTSVQGATNVANQGYVPENTQLIQQVASNPTSAASSPDQLSSFQAQLNDSYTGPSSYTDLGTQQGNVQNAQQYSNLLNTPGGNNVLVQQVENQMNPGQTSQGINTLDTLLFQGNPGAVQTAQTAAAPYNDLGTYLNSQAGNVQNAITAGQTGASQASQDALNAFTGNTGTLTNLNNAITGTTSSDLAQAQAQQAAINKDIGNLYGGVAQNNAPQTLYGYSGTPMQAANSTNYTVGQLSPQDLAALGMTQDQWNALQGSLQKDATSTGLSSNYAGSPHHFGAPSPTAQLDISQYLSQQDPTQAITNATTATPQQYQEMAAIQQLLGGKTPQGTAINPALASLAGTYNPASLNQFNYQNALTGANNLGTAEQQLGQQEANAIETNADTQHAESQHGGGFLNTLKQSLMHPQNIVGTAINPASWLPNALNATKGKSVNPTNIGLSRK